MGDAVTPLLFLLVDAAYAMKIKWHRSQRAKARFVRDVTSMQHDHANMRHYRALLGAWRSLWGVL